MHMGNPFKKTTFPPEFCTYFYTIYVTRYHKMSLKYSNTCFLKLLQIQTLHNASFKMMICGYSSLFCPAKINILCWLFFVFYCSVTWLTGYISVYKLATLRSFCGSRSHIYIKYNHIPVKQLNIGTISKWWPNNQFLFLCHFDFYKNLKNHFSKGIFQWNLAQNRRSWIH